MEAAAKPAVVGWPHTSAKMHHCSRNHPVQGGDANTTARKVKAEGMTGGPTKGFEPKVEHIAKNEMLPHRMPPRGGSHPNTTLSQNANAHPEG